MKKIVSTQGITDGLFFALTEAIRERVDDKLENLFRQTYGTYIRLSPMLSYELHNGEVTEIQLTYTVDNPTPQQLIWLCEACEDFYNLYGFMVDDIPDANSIYFCATDLFDMASLIHALDCQTVSLESVLCAVDAHLTERDAIYSPSGAHLIQIPNVEHYRIREGTLFVSPLAARHCNQLQRLEIPYGMLFDDHSLTEFPQELMVKQWTTHYDGTPVEEEEDLDDDMPIFDDHGVGYSHDGKILMSCRYTFNETHYDVPDGVEGIDFGAFCACRHFLELSIPRSVKTIGDSIFGNNSGVIIIRDE